MALYHFNVTQVSRGRGQSAVACAAYRSGEKLMDHYYGEVQDYTRKGGVFYAEIFLPKNAPERFYDRQTLWNEVEKVEKHPQAQLAYSFNVALQNEFTYEENLELARRFVQENFVDRGMMADLAIHNPDKDPDGIPNPHFHVLAPIRPLNPDGTWGVKQHREYVLDENGNRIRDQNGKYKFNAISTTDWGDPETLFEWRENWAKICNEKFEEKGLDAKIDHRSYVNQELDQLPTIHEGATVRAMEKRGIRTDKGEWNRMVKSTNALLSKLKQELKDLVTWIADISKIISEEMTTERQEKKERNYFVDTLTAYYEQRNAGAYSNKAKTANLKKYSATLNFLTDNHISSFKDLEAKISSMYSEVSDAGSKAKNLEKEIKRIDDILKAYDRFKEDKPVYVELYKIKNKNTSDQLKEAHHGELAVFYMVRRKLKEAYPDGKVPINELKERKQSLTKEHAELMKEYKRLKEEAGKAYSIKKAIDADYRKAIGQTEIDKSNRRKERNR